MNKQAEFDVHSSGYSIKLDVRIINEDVLFTLIGGDVMHIGTVTTRSAKGVVDTVIFSSSSGGMHKDNLLADVLLAKVSEKLEGNLVITSGVHVDGITKEQIVASFEMTEELAGQFLLWLEENPIVPKIPLYKNT